MRRSRGPSADTAARLLALMVARHGALADEELQALQEQQAFELLGVRRERFLELARESLAELGAGPFEHSWLDDQAQACLNRLLDAIGDEQERQRLCRLAAAALMPDGHPAHDEHLVYNHALARWHVDPAGLPPAAGARPPASRKAIARRAG